MSSQRRFSTGVDPLDEELGGGIATGRLVALTAPAEAGSELLVGAAAGARRSLFISTTCPDEAELRERVADIGDPDDVTFAYGRPGAVLEEPGSYLGAVEPESTVLVDPANGLEAATDGSYLSFLNAFKRQLRATDSVGILHCLRAEPTPAQRWLTKKRVDAVWELRLERRTRDLRSRLYITKDRGGSPPTEPIPLVLTDDVYVDTSRNIA